MPAVAKTPHTEIRIRGKIPRKLIAVLGEQYGSRVRIGAEAEDETVDILDTDWYRTTRAKLTPGKNLRIYRQNRGLTRHQMGAMLGGVPRQHIANMENGTRSIGKKVAPKLSRISGTSVEEFIG